MNPIAVSFFAALASLAFADGSTSPPVTAANEFRASLKGIDELQVYEGLPHPKAEPELTAQELKREDIMLIGGFPFYTPAVTAKDSAELKKLLRNGNTFLKFSGEKFCGGYHPDYAVSWKADEKTYYALICFGCREVLLVEGKQSLRYDLAERAFESFWELLKPHALKRPKPTK